MHDVVATTIGPLAAKALENRGCGKIKALFRNSGYLELGGRLICFGGLDLALGPFAVKCAADVQKLFSHYDVEVGTPVSCCQSLQIGSVVSISFRSARTWEPARSSSEHKSLRKRSWIRGLKALCGALPGAIPMDGLAPLLCFPVADTLCMKAARTPIAYLEELISSTRIGATSVDSSRIAPLLGLGPGLTPSGDDYLIGVLVTLRLTGHERLAQRLWKAIAPLLGEYTNQISAAYLSAAAEGYASRPLHVVLNDVLSGGSPALGARVTELYSIGHTSGWDGLAGALGTLRALLHEYRADQTASPWQSTSAQGSLPGVSVLEHPQATRRVLS
jgi:Protein of unknown function (DUF2877)